MTKPNHIFAVATDGSWFATHEDWVAFTVANPAVRTLHIGAKAQVMSEKLLSYGYKGKIIGFASKTVAMLQWDQAAPPLRLNVKHLFPRPPKKFWTVMGGTPAAGSGNNTRQSYEFTSSTRRAGSFPAVNRFESLRAAQHWVSAETRASGNRNFVILESVEVQTNGISVTPE